MLFIFLITIISVTLWITWIHRFRKSQAPIPYVAWFLLDVKETSLSHHRWIIHSLPLYLIRISLLVFLTCLFFLPQCQDLHHREGTLILVNGTIHSSQLNTQWPKPWYFYYTHPDTNHHKNWLTFLKKDQSKKAHISDWSLSLTPQAFTSENLPSLETIPTVLESVHWKKHEQIATQRITPQKIVHLSHQTLSIKAAQARWTQHESSHISVDVHIHADWLDLYSHKIPEIRLWVYIDQKWHSFSGFTATEHEAIYRWSSKRLPQSFTQSQLSGQPALIDIPHQPHWPLCLPLMGLKIAKGSWPNSLHEILDILPHRQWVDDQSRAHWRWMEFHDEIHTREIEPMLGSQYSTWVNSPLNDQAHLWNAFQPWAGFWMPPSTTHKNYMNQKPFSVPVYVQHIYSQWPVDVKTWRWWELVGGDPLWGSWIQDHTQSESADRWVTLADQIMSIGGLIRRFAFHIQESNLSKSLALPHYFLTLYQQDQRKLSRCQTHTDSLFKSIWTTQSWQSTGPFNTTQEYKPSSTLKKYSLKTPMMGLYALQTKEGTQSWVARTPGLKPGIKHTKEALYTSPVYSITSKGYHSFYQQYYEVIYVILILFSICFYYYQRVVYAVFLCLAVMIAYVCNHISLNDDLTQIIIATDQVQPENIPYVEHLSNQWIVTLNQSNISTQLVQVDSDVKYNKDHSTKYLLQQVEQLAKQSTHTNQQVLLITEGQTYDWDQTALIPTWVLVPDYYQTQLMIKQVNLSHHSNRAQLHLSVTTSKAGTLRVYINQNTYIHQLQVGTQSVTNWTPITPNTNKLNIKLEFDTDQAEKDTHPLQLPPYTKEFTLAFSPKVIPQVWTWGSYNQSWFTSLQWMVQSPKISALNQPIPSQVKLIILTPKIWEKVSEIQQEYLLNWVESGGILWLEINHQKQLQSSLNQPIQKLLPVQPILRTPQSKGMRVTYLIDRSGSMHQSASGVGLAHIAAHLTQINQYAQTQDECMVIAFGGGVEVLQYPSKIKQLATLQLPTQGSGSTALESAITLASQWHKDAQKSQWVIISDGQIADQSSIWKSWKPWFAQHQVQVYWTKPYDEFNRTDDMIEDMSDSMKSFMSTSQAQSIDWGQLHQKLWVDLRDIPQDLTGILQVHASDFWTDYIGGSLPKIKGLIPSQTKTHAQTLATVDEYPALASTQYGAGRVIASMTKSWDLQPEQWRNIFALVNPKKISDWNIYWHQSMIWAHGNPHHILSSIVQQNLYGKPFGSLQWCPLLGGLSVLSQIGDCHLNLGQLSAKTLQVPVLDLHFNHQYKRYHTRIIAQDIIHQKIPYQAIQSYAERSGAGILARHTQSDDFINQLRSSKHKKNLMPFLYLMVLVFGFFLIDLYFDRRFNQ